MPFNLPYQDLFTGSGEVIKTAYFKTPPGRLVFDGNEFKFARETPQTVNNRKVIVLADHYIHMLSVSSMFYPFTDLIDQFLKEKFDVYVYAKDVAIKLTTDNLFLLDEMISSMSETAMGEAFYRALAGAGVAADTVHILNLPEIIQILLDAPSPCITKEIYNQLTNGNRYVMRGDPLNCTTIADAEAPGYTTVASGRVPAVTAREWHKDFYVDPHFNLLEDRYEATVVEGTAEENKLTMKQLHASTEQKDQHLYFMKLRDIAHIKNIPWEQMIYLKAASFLGCEISMAEIAKIVNRIPNLTMLSIEAEDQYLADLYRLKLKNSKLVSLNIYNRSDNPKRDYQQEKAMLLSDCVSLVKIEMSGESERNKFTEPSLQDINIEASSIKIISQELRPENIAYTLYLIKQFINLEKITMYARELPVKKIMQRMSELPAKVRHKVNCLVLNGGSNPVNIDIAAIIKIFPNLQLLTIEDRYIANEAQLQHFLKKMHINVKRNSLNVKLQNYFGSSVGATNNTMRLNDPLQALNLHHATKIFYGNASTQDPFEGHYRNNVFSGKIDDSRIVTSSQAFSLTPIVGPIVILDKQPVACEYAFRKHNIRGNLAADTLYGTCEIQVNTDWQQLPSISANETVLQLTATGANGLQIPVQIGYCKANNCHYIKVNDDSDAGALHIDMLIHAPSNQEPKFSSVYATIERNCKNFNINNLTDVESNNITEAELCDRLYKNRAGACQERSIVFANKLYSRGLSDQVRYVNNAIHAYCEVKQNGVWQRLDLGGAPAELQIDDPELALSHMPIILGQNDKISAEIDIITAGTEPITVDQDLPKAMLQHLDGRNIEKYAMALLEKFSTLDIPVVYINNIDDLKFSNPANELLELVRHAAANPDKDYVIIINWDNFSSAQRVKINSLIDKKPHIGGINISSNIHIIGLEDPFAENAINDPAFYSRFDKITVVTNPPQYTIPFTETSKIEDNALVVDCFNATNWRDYLLGTWSLDDKGPKFNPSEFLQALADGKLENLTINNPPWNEESFRLFWSKACITGEFKLYGTKYSFDANKIVLNYTNTNNLHHADQIISWQDKLPGNEPYYVINSYNVEQLFKQYEFVNGILHTRPGIIEAHANTTINMFLTHNIPANKFSQLIQECEKFNVSLSIKASPNLKLPEQITNPMIASKPTITTYTDATLCIKSDNPLLIAHRIARLHKTELVFDATEAQTEYLICSTEHQKVGSTYKFKFTDSDIIKRLENGETIVLYGKLSQEFAERFASLLVEPDPHLWINGEKRHFKGKLICVVDSENAEFFSFARMAEYNAVEVPQPSRTLLLSRPPTARTETIKTNINENRFERIMNAFASNPVVYITGQTGIGKTTFVYKILQDQEGMPVFNGLDQILQWAASKSTGPNILFIDEAEMAGSDFTIFNDLFNQPPKILYNGKIINLTANHKVILSGNSVAYGGDRSQPLLVTQHPNIEVKFEPLDREYIRNLLLTPPPQSKPTVLANCFPYNANWVKFLVTGRTSTRTKMKLLDLYDWASNLDARRVLITARELKLILQLIAAGYNDEYAIASIFEQALAKDYKSQFDQKLLQVFGKTFDYVKLTRRIIAAKKLPLEDKDFIVTHSRMDALLNINGLLDVRAQCLKDNSSISMGGIILEGAPGTGKSELFDFALRSNGYHEVAGNIEAIKALTPGAKVYIKTSSAESKLEILLEAYKKGIVVVYDEINADSGTERLLNDLLMHQYAGAKAENPGFVLLGTQNPISLRGRKAASNAQERRVILKQIPEYDDLEMQQVLRHKYPQANRNYIYELIANESTKTLPSGVTYKLTFRDLERMVKESVEKLAPKHPKPKFLI